ncbi:tRNA (adenosine(37)-N6)-threonylcarbamoyltransferase complex dimerization subunit type 1 TsaB [Ruegeria pomeroyi]|uniref:Protease, putative n=2 Tax=Ruegeria pomeroyi TaxID=89184 RepID=Q5LXH1_RUEPO|nr:tRNA (adenosine(37)-N6)-threonylcarbamoyltransferase complex dimerization subunit type 1 TsaB [Ruegeria pomeroyi]HCE70929.1 tRNA (adenosine(37)-N6)-threonylcarbamoyltransferase complex dimerization subunit type 1 TsaB [Ruegeria sp.]AAV93699.1 protease, putative [Ruegeria pomeroyi DSS-3]NVK98555.1 tRNA (adenosine(37)-N6)-threonylcarbamoyltransferase complex dimerization subunit type 1 TsaB [Ruegeria pomeroyi]NVK99874.1 tRNA (adenosine(37)-N6)-threonylcarbamoyltransferase complex dimerization 
MPSDPVILAFDTSAAHCAAALLVGDRIVAATAEEMTRGQAERLMPLLEEVLAGAGLGWHDLDAIGVGIGPGNFTGIRISVSAARGLALGLGIPAVGVDGFEARALLTPLGVHPAIPAPRDHVYLAPDGGTPQLLPRDQAEALGPLQAEYSPQGLAEAIARAAAPRWRDATIPPAPLYVRPADAAPSRDRPPVLLDP